MVVCSTGGLDGGGVTAFDGPGVISGFLVAGGVGDPLGVAEAVADGDADGTTAGGTHASAISSIAGSSDGSTAT
ncbi:hypothetical protein JCM9533A_20120 [Catenuloplanes niger JCM 9533]